ncbi:MAG: class II fructose-bisphosphatase [Eggerthellaceae bacterium]|nr:class II fructose-bisphosphatase [Eggerthellaceae bacterium]MBQ6454742.1 class II fructose-bisphosphatase [Eggerthellaceae bacterium]MDO5117585.1 class II fructose-bisphosphatase [Eggerthellaceae bacterium]
MQPARIMEILGVAEKAAIACADWNGKGDKVAADQAATTAMREAFNDIDFSGRIVIGEGERDEAPMLYIGEELGRGGEEIDIAVDPLEGTNLCASNQPNALTTIAIAPRGALLFAPDTYMWKIAAATDCGGRLHIDNTVAENLQYLSEELGKPVSDINVCILKRGRHDKIVEEVRAAGARIRFIGDGDVFGAIATAVPGTGIDFYIGAGGSPEGVLACTGLKAIGGFFMGKLDFTIDKDGAEKRARAEKMDGLDFDLDAPLTMDMLVRSDDAAFIACGVTDGEMVSGVTFMDGSVTTECVVMNAADKTVRFVKTCHRGENGRVRFN